MLLSGRPGLQGHIRILTSCSSSGNPEGQHTCFVGIWKQKTWASLHLGSHCYILRGIFAYFVLTNTLVEFSGKPTLLNMFRRRLILALVQEKTVDGISQASGFLLGEKNELRGKEGLQLLKTSGIFWNNTFIYACILSMCVYIYMHAYTSLYIKLNHALFFFFFF